MRVRLCVSFFRACCRGNQKSQGRGLHDEAIQKAFRNCQATVREHDYENYLWARSLSPGHRAPIMMLRSLNAEISMIGDMVAQGGDAVRKIRFQWWKDAVDSAYLAREADQVNHAPFSGLQAIEDFAESTQSQLLYLQLEAANVKNSDADHAASHLGKAIGIASLLRGMKNFLSRKMNYLPVDLCTQHGVVVEKVLQGREWESKGMQDVVFEMASTAHLHLKQSKELHGYAHKVPAEARRLFLSGTSCRLFLEALERHQFQLFSSGMAKGGYTPLWYAMQLHWDKFKA